MMSHKIIDPNKEDVKTILLVDDDAAVREAIIDILELEGIHVIGAANGEEGIKRYEQNQDKVRLILLDMSMPGLSGTETFRQLCAVDQEVKIILSSGFGEKQIASKLQSNNLVGFLPKPYDSNHLIEIVRQHI